MASELEGHADGDVSPVFVEAGLEQVELQAVAAVGVDYVVVEACLFAVAVYPAQKVEVEVDVHVLVELVGDAGLDGEVEGLQLGVVGSWAGHCRCATNTGSGSRTWVHIPGRVAEHGFCLGKEDPVFVLHNVEVDVGANAVGALCSDVGQLAGGVEFVAVVERESVGDTDAPAVVDVVADEGLDAVFAQLVGHIVASFVGALAEMSCSANDPFVVGVVLSLSSCG